MAGQRVYLGLGSNLDNPLAQVCRAVEELAALPQTTLVERSHWYASTAVGPGQQPDYVNGVAALDTHLPPETLLDALQAIEQGHQRVRLERWGPRTLDLDILLYGQRVIDSERLQIPHPWLSRRNFVLLPLADVAPQLVLPDGTTLQKLLQNTSRTGITRLNRSCDQET